jgi:16S rRNA processing protein RimM
LAVKTVDGIDLGTVSHLFATGANDVLVVRGDRERLLPYIPDVVRRVDPSMGLIEVDWDPEF